MTNLELKKYALEKAIEISNSDHLGKDVIEKANIFIEFLQVSDETSQHKERHIFLCRCFDELLANFICHTKESPLKKTIKDLMEWSHQQTFKS